MATHTFIWPGMHWSSYHRFSLNNSSPFGAQQKVTSSGKPSLISLISPSHLGLEAPPPHPPRLPLARRSPGCTIVICISTPSLETTYVASFLFAAPAPRAAWHLVNAQ